MPGRPRSVVLEGYIVPTRPSGDVAFVLDTINDCECFLVLCLTGKMRGQTIWKRRRELVVTKARLATKSDLEYYDFLKFLNAETSLNDTSSENNDIEAGGSPRAPENLYDLCNTASVSAVKSDNTSMEAQEQDKSNASECKFPTLEAELSEGWRGLLCSLVFDLLLWALSAFVRLDTAMVPILYSLAPCGWLVFRRSYFLKEENGKSKEDNRSKIFIKLQSVFLVVALCAFFWVFSLGSCWCIYPAIHLNFSDFPKIYFLSFLSIALNRVFGHFCLVIMRRNTYGADTISHAFKESRLTGSCFALWFGSIVTLMIGAKYGLGNYHLFWFRLFGIASAIFVLIVRTGHKTKAEMDLSEKYWSVGHMVFVGLMGGAGLTLLFANEQYPFFLMKLVWMLPFFLPFSLFRKNNKLDHHKRDQWGLVRMEFEYRIIHHLADIVLVSAV